MAKCSLHYGQFMPHHEDYLNCDDKNWNELYTWRCFLTIGEPVTHPSADASTERLKLGCMEIREQHLIQLTSSDFKCLRLLPWTITAELSLVLVINSVKNKNQILNRNQILNHNQILNQINQSSTIYADSGYNHGYVNVEFLDLSQWNFAAIIRVEQECELIFGFEVIFRRCGKDIGVFCRC